jgi:hypothetical protein
MPDDKTKPGGQDRLRINVNEPYELRDWAKTLSVSEAELKVAVQAVGDDADAVRIYLTNLHSAR